MDCKLHKLVADVAVFAAGQVLLVRYHDVSRYDGQRGWFLPDDHLETGEHPDSAASRILAEQAELGGQAPQLSHIESLSNGAWHLIFHYVTTLDAPLPVAPAGNVAAAEWFPLDALPPRSEIAHDGWAVEVLDALSLS